MNIPNNPKGYFWSSDYQGVIFCTGGTDTEDDTIYLTEDGDIFFPAIEDGIVRLVEVPPGESWDWEPSSKDVCEDYGGFRIGDLVKCVLGPTGYHSNRGELTEGEVYRVRALREATPDIYLETPDNGAPLNCSWDHKRFEAVSYPDPNEDVERLWSVSMRGNAQESSCVRWGTFFQVTRDFPGDIIKPLHLG